MAASNKDAVAPHTRPATTLGASPDLKRTRSALVEFVGSWRYFLAGCVGGMSGVLAGQPFDTIKVRIQTNTSFVERFFPYSRVAVNETARTVLARTWADEGLRGLYRGMSSPLLAVGVQKSVAFGTYGMARAFLDPLEAARSNQDPKQPRRAGGRVVVDPDLTNVFLAGMAGGVANTTILTPVDQLKICLQVEGPTAIGEEGALTLRGACRSFLAGGSLAATAQGALPMSPLQTFARGVRAVYTAWPSTLMREVPGYALYFTVYERLSRWRRQAAADWAIPFIGGVAGAAMWAMYYPLDVIKSRTMAKVANSSSDLATSWPARDERLASLRKSLRWSSVAKELVEERGLRGFYTGLSPALLRAVPTHAAVFVMYEAVLGGTEYMMNREASWQGARA